MTQLTEEQFNSFVDVKLETTRLICQKIADSSVISLPCEAKYQFANVIELVTILMIKHAGQLPYEWTSEKLLEVYQQELPLALDQKVQPYAKNILLTYSQVIHEAFGLQNYLDISKKLAS